MGDIRTMEHGSADWEQMERGYLAIMPELLPQITLRLPGHTKIVGSRNCDGVVMLVLEGPYIRDGKRYVVNVREHATIQTYALEEVP